MAVFNYYHGSIQVFAGSGAPPNNISFTTMEMNGLHVNYKFGESWLYQSHVPLSTLFNDTRYHQVNINHDLISVIIRVAGKHRTFTNCNRSHHNGFLPFFGEQCNNSQCHHHPVSDLKLGCRSRVVGITRTQLTLCFGQKLFIYSMTLLDQHQQSHTINTNTYNVFAIYAIQQEIFSSVAF